MKICDLISTFAPVKLFGDVNVEVDKLTYDSRGVECGSCFFAIRGEHFDGHNFIESAIEHGAVAIVCEDISLAQEGEGDPEVLKRICVIVVESSEEAMAEMARIFYRDPSRELNLVGITGTNGKTTTATLLADLFEALGYKSGLISTVTYRIAGEHMTSTHTTPDTLRLNEMLRRMVDVGCEYCFMEVSSHSIIQNRIGGLTFAGGVFTNLTHDHLDYHGTFREYLTAKKRLFDGLRKGSFALTNIDDRNGGVMVQNCAARVLSYSMRSVADLRARMIEQHLDGMLLSIEGREVWVNLLGRFNVYNLLAAYGVAREFGVAEDDILVAMSGLRAASGRFEHFNVAGGRTIIVDYAHTPDALSVVLKTIDEINGGGGERRGVITVCGCGGDRDKTKRAEMARIAYEGSSTVIFTSDNPRTESPEAILEDMIEGVNGVEKRGVEHRWIKVSDRSEAIRMAVMLSKDRDIILIAGKGHETYQIIGTQRHHFDDREEARKAVEQYLM